MSVHNNRNGADIYICVDHSDDTDADIGDVRCDGSRYGFDSQNPMPLPAAVVATPT
jgi:hypothetical protein